MSRFPVFGKTLRDQRVPVLAWGAALLALAFVHVLAFPPYRDAAQSSLGQSSYYEKLAGEAGGIGTPGGYLNAEYFSAAPLLVLFFAIIAATGALAGEEGAGTLDLVLAQPVRRARLLIEKTAALVVLVLVLSMASLPGLLAGRALISGFDISAATMARACANMAPIAVFYMGLALLGGAAMPGRTWATVVSIGAAIAGFFLNSYGAFVEILDQPRKLSPFYWTNYGKVISGGFDWVSAGAFVMAAGCFVALALVLFTRRDISSGGRSFRALRRFMHVGGMVEAAATHQGAATLDLTYRRRGLPIFWKTLRDQRVSFAAWGAAIVILSVVTILIYAPFKDVYEAFDKEGGFAPLAGAAGNISSPPGYLALEFFSYIPLIILIAVVIAGTGAIAGDESGGTLELLLAQPTSRRRIVVEKSAALIAGVVFMTAGALLGLLVPALLVDFDISLAKLTAATLYMIPLDLLFLSIAVFGSAAVPSRTGATIVVVGAAIAAYFLNTLGAFVDSLDLVRRLSPFYWADFSRVMVYGMDWERAAIFIAISAMFFGLAVVTLERRDISATRPSWSQTLRRLARLRTA